MDASGPFRTFALARDADLLKDTVREAGELALSLFRTELRNWTKGAPTTSIGCPSAWSGSSIRSTVRAAISPAAKTGA